jgi:hypothetical protein
MTLRSWARQLFARPTRRAPARCPLTPESLDVRAPLAITCQPAGGTAKPHRRLSAPGEPALGRLVHPGRFSPVTIGFWLGGAGMGTGGFLLGALMPHHHLVAVAISVLWWGLYFGCFGASVGALVGVLTDHAPPCLPAMGDGAGMEPTELERDSRAADAASTAVCASQSTRASRPPTGSCAPRLAD